MEVSECFDFEPEPLDIQVMQVANFVRSNWGNRGPQVTLDDVARFHPQ